MKIRKAKKEDLKEIVEIFITEFRKKPYNEKWSEKKALKKINDYYKNGIIILGEESEKVIEQ